jgi:hypothetical protein
VAFGLGRRGGGGGWGRRGGEGVRQSQGGGQGGGEARCQPTGMRDRLQFHGISLSNLLHVSSLLLALSLCFSVYVGLLCRVVWGESDVRGWGFVWTIVQPIESGLDVEGMLGAAVRFAKTHSCGEAA